MAKSVCWVLSNLRHSAITENLTTEVSKILSVTRSRDCSGNPEARLLLCDGRS